MIDDRALVRRGDEHPVRRGALEQEVRVGQEARGERAVAERDADLEARVLDDPKFREKLSTVEIELKALEMSQLRIIADEKGKAKGRPNPASSILKLKGSQIQQWITDLTMDVAGPYIMPFAMSDEGSGRNESGYGPEFAAAAAPAYFNKRKVSIYGGSNEIQRNIIAKAILGF